jgi:DNA-binding Xre family transcriptional regulator
MHNNIVLFTWRPRSAMMEGMSRAWYGGKEHAMRVDPEKLKRARLGQALTLRQLAENIGVAHLTLWRLENGAVGSIRPTTLRKIADGLGVAPDTLIDWGDEEETAGKRMAA